AEKPAEAQYRVRHFAGDLVDHQPFDVADHVSTRPAYRGALDTVARDELVRLGHDVNCHSTLHTSDEREPTSSSPSSSALQKETTTLPFREGWLGCIFRCAEMPGRFVRQR